MAAWPFFLWQNITVFELFRIKTRYLEELIRHSFANIPRNHSKINHKTMNPEVALSYLYQKMAQNALLLKYYDYCAYDASGFFLEAASCFQLGVQRNFLFCFLPDQKQVLKRSAHTLACIRNKFTKYFPLMASRKKQMCASPLLPVYQRCIRTAGTQTWSICAG